MSASKWGRRVSILSSSALWILLCAATATISFAQVSATLSGTVMDSSGAAVTSASVTATNVSTGAVVNATSNETGEYSFLSLAPGKYDLVAKKEGFQSSSLKGVELVVYQKARLDISLNIGDVKTTVEVAGSAALIETTTANVGTTIGEMPIVKLPLNLRRYRALATLVPGTTPDNGGTANSNKASPFSETSYNANGARSSSNNYNRRHGFAQPGPGRFRASASARCHPGIQDSDQRLLRSLRNHSGFDYQPCDQVGNQSTARIGLRIFSQRHLRRNQPLQQ